MRKFTLISLIAVMLLTFVPGLACAEDPSTVIFRIGTDQYQLNDQLVKMDAMPFIEEGRTFVPVRYMSEPFGIAVDWNSFLRLVTLSQDNTKVYLVVGVKKILVKHGEDNAVDIAKKIISEGSDLDVAPLIREGRTYLPARWVAQEFGYLVKWDPGSKTVAIVPPEVEMPEVKLPEPVIEKPVEEVQPVASSPFKRPDIDLPKKPRAMVMGFLPKSKEVVFWNYNPGALENQQYTIDGGPKRRWEETLPDYLCPEPINKWRVGPVNVKILLTAFGVPEEAIQYDPKSKTLRVYGAGNPDYFELKDGGDNVKIVWDDGGHTTTEDLNGKSYVKNGKFFLDATALANVIMQLPFGLNTAASFGGKNWVENDVYEGLYTADFIFI